MRNSLSVPSCQAVALLNLGQLAGVEQGTCSVVGVQVEGRVGPAVGLVLIGGDGDDGVALTCHRDTQTARLLRDTYDAVECGQSAYAVGLQLASAPLIIDLSQNVFGWTREDRHGRRVFVKAPITPAIYHFYCLRCCIRRWC